MKAVFPARPPIDIVPKKLRAAARKNALPAPRQCADEMGLKWVTDATSGIHRVGHGASFVYRNKSGDPIRRRATLSRIKSLVIPPAWTDVWICSAPNGHIQAIGRDARGRKQYIYHRHWRTIRDQTKFDRMVSFGRALPQIRRITARHLRTPGLTRKKVLAAVVQLLEKTLIRIGNDEYARDNDHFGLTTIRNQHATVRAATIRFTFSGKSGVAHDIQLSDPRLAKIVRACQEIPNQELFTYLKDNGKTWVDVTSSDVNAYLKEITHQDFTAKDFRTWAGTVLAAESLENAAPYKSQMEAKKNIIATITCVANRLGNTKSVCRKCYIHPAVLTAYLDGSLQRKLRSATRIPPMPNLRIHEIAMLRFLEKHALPAR